MRLGLECVVSSGAAFERKLQWVIPIGNSPDTFRIYGRVTCCLCEHLKNFANEVTSQNEEKNVTDATPCVISQRDL